MSLTADRAAVVESACVAGGLVPSLAPDLQPIVAHLRDPSGELLAEVRNPVLLDEPLPIAGVPRLLATRPFDGPESWAAFVLQGDWQVPPLRSGDARGGASP